MDKAIYDWSVNAADNGDADSSFTEAENMAAGLVNNSERAIMARHAAFIALIGGNTALVSYSGTGNAYTVASPSGHAFGAFPTGLIFTFIPNATNSGASTLALDGMTAKDIRLPDGTATPAGALVSGVAYLMRYTGSEFRMISGAPGAGATLYQPKDADLDTWATLTPSANFQTLVTQTFPQMRASLDLEAGVDFNAYSARLADIAALGVTADNFLVANGSNIVLKTPADSRTSLGLGTAAVVADSSLVHISGAESFTGVKSARPSASGVRFNVGPDYNSGVAIETGESVLDIRAWTGAPTLRLSRHNISAWDIEIDSSGNLDVNGPSGQNMSFTAANTFEINGNTATHAGNIQSQIQALGSVNFGDGSFYAQLTGGLALFQYDTSDNSYYDRANNRYVWQVGGSAVGRLDSTGFQTGSGVPYNQSGKQAIPIPASAMIPRTTNGAATGLTQLANGIMLSTLDFDGTTQEFAQFSMAMPKGWNESTITAQFGWTADSGSGAAQWGIRAVAISDDDVLNASFGTGQVVTDTMTATGDLMITAETSAVTIAGSPAEGDFVVFEVYRVPADAADTLNGIDAKLAFVRLFITTNAANDA